jgi:hypothetical protein
VFRFLKKSIPGIIMFGSQFVTFQLTQGNSIASRKTPRSGPLVADVISMDDSITPERVATPNEIPMIRIPYTDPEIRTQIWLLNLHHGTTPCCCGIRPYSF